MSVCEWCWQAAYARALADTSKTQAEHYYDIMEEQEELGPDAECPNVRETTVR